MLKRWIPLWAVPVLIAMAIGTVWLRLYIVRTSYAINQTDRAIRNQRLERERTELKLVGLKSPRRLEQLARTKFNLNQPKPEQVVHLK